MFCYLAYLGSAKQFELTKKSFARFGVQNIDDGTFALAHPVLPNTEVRITLIPDIHALPLHLKHKPVDFLILDERNGGLNAYSCIHKIEKDVQDLAQQWGPDFHFPKGRMMILIDEDEHAAVKSFHLGRLNVRDVLAVPSFNVFRILKWIANEIRDERAKRPAKVGIAFNGGGIDGYLFQGGCALALMRALSGKGLYDFDVYSGVSSGSIIAGSIAAGVPITEIVASMYSRSSVLPNLKASVLFDFSPTDILKRLLRQLREWQSAGSNKFFDKALGLIPTALFRGDALANFIRDGLSCYSTANDFRALQSELYIGVTHQDSFQHIIMGTPPWKHIPISDAIRASCALPPFFGPHQIENDLYVDGQISGPCDLELMVRRGCRLIIVVDPLVPFANSNIGATERGGGIYNLIQAVKALISKRFTSELAHITERFPDVDFIILQPYGSCAEQMKGSPVKFSINTRVVDLAYRSTLRQLAHRHGVYQSKLEKYGIQLASPADLETLESSPQIE
jgi:predicted acylesterase/phospholipase RssA